MMFQGVYTAMVTPFTADGKLDEARLREQVEFQIEGGVSGLVPCGTTGESPTLSHDEHRKVIEVVVDQAAQRVQIIAGAGSNSTAEAIELTKHAKEVGADATLQVNPYYNKPTQDGLYAHYSAIAVAVELPLMLYNIPGRSAVALAPETVYKLAEHPNVTAIKEATGSMDMSSDVVANTSLDVLSGDDSMTLPIISVGGKGVVSVISNILPRKLENMVRAAMANEYENARAAHLELFGLAKGMLGLATNPIPVKTAMSLMGMDTGVLRLPMTPMDDVLVAKLKTLMLERHLISE